ncbi:proline dehydrogenase family protein [Eisenibacter elegans]|jgi:proline dehydrogenase|uniref:proline dehydrogenase family protein n=1 Tax=Eisenibacter elegans TaxID=997 RepID=UPI000411057C|nr:proline dehydrogenase family protein [Eisenibacter elegans]
MDTLTNTPLSFEDTSIAFSAKSDAALRKTHWLFALMNRPWLVGMGTGLLKTAFKLRLPVRYMVKKTIFEQFCGGENIHDCLPTIQILDKYHIGTILDYSVEGEKSLKGFEASTDEIIRTIQYAAQHRDKIPFAVFKVTGIGYSGILEKVQANVAMTESEKVGWQNIQNRVDRICQQAYEHKVRIFIDAEESWFQQTIDQLAYTMMERYNREQVIVYNTYQLYLQASYAKLQKDIQQAKEQGYFLGAKLVRGAYMEKERARAKEKGYQDPVQPNKAATDEDFDRALQLCVMNKDWVDFCAGTHNEASSYALIQLMQNHNIAADDSGVFFAQLYGMSDHISYNLANAGYNVAKYVPYGPVKSVIPYLIRRAEENTSVAGQSSREYTLVSKEVQRRRKAAK